MPCPWQRTGGLMAITLSLMFQRKLTLISLLLLVRLAFILTDVPTDMNISFAGDRLGIPKFDKRIFLSR